MWAYSVRCITIEFILIFSYRLLLKSPNWCVKKNWKYIICINQMGAQEIHFSSLCLIKTVRVYWIKVIIFSLFSVLTVALLCKFLNFVRKTLFIFPPIFFERDWQWKLSFDIQDPKSEAYSLNYELSGGFLSYPTRGLTWIKKNFYLTAVCMLFSNFWFGKEGHSGIHIPVQGIQRWILSTYR